MSKSCANKLALALPDGTVKPSLMAKLVMESNDQHLVSLNRFIVDQ